MRRKVEIDVDESYVNPEDEYIEDEDYPEYEETVADQVVNELRLIRIYLLLIALAIGFLAGVVMMS